MTTSKIREDTEIVFGDHVLRVEHFATLRTYVDCKGFRQLCERYDQEPQNPAYYCIHTIRVLNEMRFVEGQYASNPKSIPPAIRTMAEILDVMRTHNIAQIYIPNHMIVQD